MTCATNTRKPRRRKRLEHGIQVGLFDWRAMQLNLWPELALLHAIPNGAALKSSVRRTQSGKSVRYSVEGESLRREGLTTGVPDVCWPVARGGHHGLYIEHKSPGNYPSKDQKRIIAMLVAQGYLVRVSYDVKTSIELIGMYWCLGEFVQNGPTLCSYAPRKP